LSQDKEKTRLKGMVKQLLTVRKGFQSGGEFAHGQGLDLA
jgi:hypothetical protein